MSTIFISYSQTNQDFARKLRDDLMSAGYTVRWDMDAAENVFPHRSEQWHREAEVYLAVITPGYLQDPLPVQQLAEFLHLRQQRGTTLIPLLLERVELPESLRETEIIDFTESYEPALQRLLAALASREKGSGASDTADVPAQKKGDAETGTSPHGAGAASAAEASHDVEEHLPNAAVTPIQGAEALAQTAERPEAPPVPDHGSAQEPEQPPSGFSVAPASISDQPALRDTLGFEPYVRAVAEFLTNEGTRPPLTLSIEGEWGSGKTSFMHQLQQAIRDRQVKKGEKAPVTVWFNPWRHDREEAVWAAFALEFLRGVSEQLPFAERWRGHWRLLHRRFSWRDGWLDVVRAFTALVAAIAIIGILVSVLADREAIAQFSREIAGGDGGEAGLLAVLLGAGGVGASLAVAVTLWKQVKSFVGNPLRFDLKQYFRSPDYQSRISFIEHFHEDFGRIVTAYVGERKVYVFIDDLDRCQTPKAADLMQALNLMMGTAEQPIVFILGMDREKIAASLAVKFKDLLPYVTADPARPGKIEDGEAALRGLEYGSEFIEKFVQLSFRIPQPRDADVAALLRSISGDGKPAAPAPSAGERDMLTQIPVDTSGPIRPRPFRPAREATPWRASTKGETGFTQPPVAEPVREALQQEVAVDSERLHEIVRMVAPTLDYNPRRIKQFVNVFRLKAYVAIATGLVDADATAAPAGLTFEQLGKFVALGLRWPLFMADLDAEHDLLERLQAVAAGQRAPTAVGAEAFWRQRTRLLDLLRVGMVDGEGKLVADAEPVYSMKGLDVDALLQVAAPPPARTSAAEGAILANA